MNPYHPTLQKNIQDMRFKFHDSLDNRNHPTAHALHQEFERLQSDMASGRDPRALETRLHGIQTRIMQAEHQGHGVMSTDSSNFFNQRIEQMRNNLRQHPHYN